ncbi:hypothetical protein C2S52_008361 [Perilla frutescens var. hirtella]|nr:hypothetical protein C2S52_008361 [Perilla frutescens var. hirtella]
MAKFRTAIIAAALFCLFTVSLARAPPKIDESATTTDVALPLPDADPALRLPSEPINTQTEAKANAEADPSSAVISAVPLTEITFRPINRRFHLRSKRPCRHQFKFYPTMKENEEISYGNDMILSSGENSDFELPIARGGGKRIPGRWMRTHHHHHHHLRYHDEDSDSDSDDEEDVKKVVFKRYGYDRFDREKKLNKLRKHFRVHNEEEEKKKKGGFMRGVRKFLDHYF